MNPTNSDISFAFFFRDNDDEITITEISLETILERLGIDPEDLFSAAITISKNDESLICQTLDNEDVTGFRVIGELTNGETVPLITSNLPNVVKDKLPDDTPENTFATGVYPPDFPDNDFIAMIMQNPDMCKIVGLDNDIEGEEIEEINLV